MTCGRSIAPSLMSICAHAEAAHSTTAAAAMGRLKVTGLICTTPVASEESQYIFVNRRSLAPADKLYRKIRDFFSRHRLLSKQNRRGAANLPTNSLQSVIVSPTKRKLDQSSLSFAKLRQDNEMFPCFFLHIEVPPHLCDFHFSGQRNIVQFVNETAVRKCFRCLFSV